MPHTQSRYQQDLGFTDASIFLGIGDIVVNNTTNGVVTRNAAGDWSVNQAASLTVIYAANLTNAIIRRLGFGEDLQEQFGGAGIPASAQPQFYRPDLGIVVQSTIGQITPRTALKVKGFKLLSIDVIYMVTVANLTSQAFRVDQSNFINGAVLAPTVVLASGQNGLSNVFQANPFVTNVPMAAAQQIYRISADSMLLIENTIVTPVNSLYRLYGWDCKIEFNFN